MGVYYVSLVWLLLWAAQDLNLKNNSENFSKIEITLIFTFLIFQLCFKMNVEHIIVLVSQNTSWVNKQYF